MHTHTLQHMRQNVLHRLLHAHHTELRHTTACSEKAHVVCALECIPGMIFVCFLCFKMLFYMAVYMRIMCQIVRFEGLKWCISCQKIKHITRSDTNKAPHTTHTCTYFRAMWHI